MAIYYFFHRSLLSLFFIWKALSAAGSLNGIRLRYEREAHERTRQSSQPGGSFNKSCYKKPDI